MDRISQFSSTHKTHHKYRQLTNALTNLKAACDNLQYKGIPNKRNLVEDKLNKLDTKITNDIIDAKSNANTQIGKLYKQPELVKKLIPEIKALQKVLEGDDISVITNYTKALTEKEAAVRSEIDKNKNSIEPDSVKTNAPPKE